MAEEPASADAATAAGVGEAPPTAGRGRERRQSWGLFLGTGAVVVLLDQLTKVWVDSSFELADRAVPAGQPGGPTELLGDLVRIAKTYNDGAIFGLLDATASLMAVLTLLVVAGLSWYVWRHGATAGPLVILGLGLVLGGAIGNLIDRVSLGQVIDFVDMGIGDTRWYAWNVADASVFIGILVLFGAALLGDRAIPGRGPATRPT